MPLLSEVVASEVEIKLPTLADVKPLNPSIVTTLPFTAAIEAVIPLNPVGTPSPRGSLERVKFEFFIKLPAISNA